LIGNLEFNMTNRQADIAVRATPAPPDYLVGRKLRSIKWSVYAGKKYKSKLPVTINQLKGHALIGAAGSMKNLPALLWLEKKYPEQIKIRCDELTAMAAFVEAGHGLAILPDDQQRPELKKLFTLEPSESSDLWLLTHPDLRYVERIKLVMQHLVKSFTNEKVI
jgi:DNA-binding transcriptional LysR family regulator